MRIVLFPFSTDAPAYRKWPVSKYLVFQANAISDVFCSYTNGRLPNITVLHTTRDHDKLRFQLAAGNNYGPLFGVYMSMGQRQKAKYAAEYKCLSGRDYNTNVINPSKGKLAEYVCA